MLKRAVEAGLARGLGPWLERRSRASVAVLAYHNVVPDGETPGADCSLHLPRSSFARQLDALAETHRVVPLREVLDALRDDRPPEGPPRAAITFDDAYRGAMTAGLDELARRELPTTVFVAPGELGSDGFWWDHVPLDHVDRRSGPWLGIEDTGSEGSNAGPPSREILLTAWAGHGEAILEKAASEDWSRLDVPWHARPVEEDELLAAADRDGVTFGAHGWSHANLARLDADELAGELDRPLAWLRERLGEDEVLPALAYPYGRWTEGVGRAASEAGYGAAFRVTGGRIAPSSASAFALPRINVPAGVSIDGFRLRVLGLVG